MQYGQRAVMKMLRYIKLRTNTTAPEDIAIQVNRNHLRRHVAMSQPTQETTAEYLASFAQPFDWKLGQEKP
jgi:proteasome activator subunit 4